MGMYEESLRHFLKPIWEFLDDPKCSEIMINGPTEIWIEKGGQLTLTNAKFTPEGIEAAARNMAQYVGRMLDDERPRLDARLPDGSRIHIVMPPIARKGCTISIRKFFPDKLTVANLVEFGSMTPAMAEFIDACVQLKENIIVSGGTGSGKTTMLNCVAGFIDDEERIITIEDSAELQMNQEHLVPFESRPPDKFGKGKVDMGDLLQSSLRLRPDRIVVGEVRGGEAFHLMQAMNTGHGGSLATVHANTPTDTLRRLESLCLQSGIDLPMVAVRAQVASAINITLCCARLGDGSRRTTHISEVLPLNDKGDYRTQDIFVFTQTHKDEDGKIHGYHSPTGLLPTFFNKLSAYGFGFMDEAFFDPATYGQKPPPIFVYEGFSPRWSPSLKNRETGEPDPDSNPVAEMLMAQQEEREAEINARAAERKRCDEAKAEKLEAARGNKPASPPEPPPPPALDEGDPPTRVGPVAGAPGPDPDSDDALSSLADELDELGEAAPVSADEDESTDPGAAEKADAAIGDDEDAAIAAALLAEDEAVKPSIQLSEDFAEEAKAYETEHPDKPGAPKGRPRRKRGGTVGRK